MPDARSHRGAHPEDVRDFAVGRHEVLRTAAAELSFLLARDYAPDASIKLGGAQGCLTTPGMLTRA